MRHFCIYDISIKQTRELCLRNSSRSTSHIFVFRVQTTHAHCALKRIQKVFGNASGAGNQTSMFASDRSITICDRFDM